MHLCLGEKVFQVHRLHSHAHGWNFPLIGIGMEEIGFKETDARLDEVNEVLLSLMVAPIECIHLNKCEMQKVSLKLQMYTYIVWIALCTECKQINIPQHSNVLCEKNSPASMHKRSKIEIPIMEFLGEFPSAKFSISGFVPTAFCFICSTTERQQRKTNSKRCGFTSPFRFVLFPCVHARRSHIFIGVLALS